MTEHHKSQHESPVPVHPLPDSTASSGVLRLFVCFVVQSLLALSAAKSFVLAFVFLAVTAHTQWQTRSFDLKCGYPNECLDRSIQTAKDIKQHFVTYSYEGN